MRDDNRLVLRFELPDTACPSEGLDPRTLSLAITGLRIDETDEEENTTVYEACNHYSFGKDGNAEKYLLNGWHESESGHTWTSKCSEMVIKTDRLVDFDLDIFYGSYTPSGKTEVYINDVFVQTLKEGTLESQILVLKEMLKEDADQILSFYTPDAVSPESADGSRDSRVLGICLYSQRC